YTAVAPEIMLPTIGIDSVPPKDKSAPASPRPAPADIAPYGFSSVKDMTEPIKPSIHGAAALIAFAVWTLAETRLPKGKTPTTSSATEIPFFSMASPRQFRGASCALIARR